MSEKRLNVVKAPEIPAVQETCAECNKSPATCVCDVLPKGSLTPKTRVLFLQHPQEPDKVLGSAVLAQLALKGAVLKTGLSWPNLSAALGEEATSQRWGVLYLGTQKSSKAPEKKPSDTLSSDSQPLASAESLKTSQPEVTILSPRGDPRLEKGLDGIVILDGNWRQAKALWWRNAWLLKLNRIVLAPKNSSLYGSLRREPRRESVSSLEAVALTLGALEESPAIKESLLSLFRTFLQRCRDSGVRPAPAPRHGGGRNRRRRG
jgi:DTW domain-containing protein YfiP